jgi:hypothetical protein
MTYPPQPPGPPQGPYGPPPGQGPYNQGPNPYQPPWGGPGGYPMGPPPKKSRTGLIATLIVVAILVVGGGGVAAYLLLGRDDDAGKDSGQGGGEGTGARGAAQTYVQELETALNTPGEQVDLSKLEPVTCAEDLTRMKDEFTPAKGDGPGAETKVRIRMKDFERTADGATFTLTRRVTPGGQEPDSRDMTVAKEDAGWKVCGLFSSPGGDDNGDGDSGGDETSSPSREVPPNPIPTT